MSLFNIRVLAVSGVAVAVALGLIGLLQIGPVDASRHRAERSFSATSVAPGDEVVVTITAYGFGSGGQIAETLSAGFEYVSSDPVGAPYNPDDRTVRYTLLGGETIFKYTVTALSGEDDYSFSGILKNFDQEEAVIGGPSTITVASGTTTEPPPGQGDGEGEGGESEATASRSFSPTSQWVREGEQGRQRSLEVTITAADYGFGGQIVETVPSGFEYVSSDADGDPFNLVDRTVTFTLVDETTFKYTVTAPGRNANYRFSGVLIDSDKMSHTIGGSSSITVEGALGASASRSFSPTSVSKGGNLEVTITAAQWVREAVWR
jgi:hypothetical protein